MVAFVDVYLGWSEPNAYHQICMCHLASTFMTRFKDKCLKQLLCRAALETKVEKFNMHMDTIGRINQDTLSWLEAIPFEKWALSHDGGEEYTPYVDVKINANVVKITVVSQMTISNDLEETHGIAIDVLRVIGENHYLHSTHEPSMRPP
ncbi:hypothetical protein CK203_021664 [Vitis vinifera]|nr:hypothetical protein CK203_021664 [Vitis vinifera]